MEARRTTAPIEDAQFWKLGGVEESYWDDYIATRPTYDHRIMDPVFEYHNHHLSSFDSALDIGCGSGSAARALLSRFRHVTATDNDPKSLHSANQKLAQFPENRLAFILSPGETIDQHCAPGSVDLIASAESFPVLDTEESLRAFHKILRPKGTLAIWFYGRMNFTEPDFGPRCQPIFDMILDLAFTRIVSGCGPGRKRAWRHTSEAMSSWLDYIPFDPLKWQDVRRHKWNPHMTMPFFGPNACDFQVAAKSNVAERETTTSHIDLQFWRMDLDILSVRRFVAAAFPWPAELATPTPEMEKLFKELEMAMGGPNAQRAFSWPVSLILASKKDENHLAPCNLA